MIQESTVDPEIQSGMDLDLIDSSSLVFASGMDPGAPLTASSPYGPRSIVIHVHYMHIFVHYMHRHIRTPLEWGPQFIFGGSLGNMNSQYIFYCNFI